MRGEAVRWTVANRTAAARCVSNAQRVALGSMALERAAAAAVPRAALAAAALAAAALADEDNGTVSVEESIAGLYEQAMHTAVSTCLEGRARGLGRALFEGGSAHLRALRSSRRWARRPGSMGSRTPPTADSVGGRDTGLKPHALCTGDCAN